MSILHRAMGHSVATEERGAIADAIAARSRSSAGVVDGDQALRHTAVFACVRLISEGIAALPASVYRRSGETREPLESQPPIVTNPHRDLTAFEWRRQILTSMLLRGNAYALIVARDPDGWPTKLTPLDPSMVTCSGLNGRWLWRINGQAVTTYAEGGDLVHFPAFQVPGRPLGLSPIELAAAAIGVGLSAEDFAGNWFEDGAAPSSILESEVKLNDDDSRKLQAKWAAAHGSGSRFPAVLSGGVTWTPISITPDESQFLETQKFSVGQVARVYGVPPHMIGDVEKSTSWGTGIEQQHISYITHTLMPWIQSLDGRMTQLRPADEYVRTNTSAMLRADFKTRATAYTQARTAGWMSVNDIRALEEMAPVEDGDTYIQPLNMGPLGTQPAGYTDGGSPDSGADVKDSPP